MTRNTTTLPIIIGGAVVLSGVGLLARRRLRRKPTSLADADLSIDEWQSQVEFEDADAGTSG